MSAVFVEKKEIDPVVNTPADSPINAEAMIIPVVDVHSVGEDVHSLLKVVVLSSCTCIYYNHRFWNG